MSASGLALAADTAIRIASLNLCTDEHLLLLARPDQIVSLSHLSQDPGETTLWRSARLHRKNDGSFEGILRQNPTIVLTMGGSGGRARERLADRFGIRILDLPYPQNPAEVLSQARIVAKALARPEAATPWAARLARLAASRPRAEEGAFIGQGGDSLAPTGLGARWLALAGFIQPSLDGGRLSLERLATRPPKWLIRSEYRTDQHSRGATWLRHPLVTRLASRTLATDGRSWTCGGLPMMAEIERLRTSRAQ